MFNIYCLESPTNADLENLKRANLTSATTVIILGDDAAEPSARDAKVVLSALTVESMHPTVYTIVELVNEDNVRHCKRANADEIIVGEEFSSKLISRAALDHGVSKVISELLSSRTGNDINIMQLPGEFTGKKFIEIFTQMKQEKNSIVLAIMKDKGGEVISNPSGDYILEDTDNLIIISTEKPE